MALAREHNIILDKIQELYTDIFMHNGFGELRVEMRFLKKGQKEVIIRCGKDFRYVVDYDTQAVKPLGAGA
ncbi:MAG: hypothetical protein MI799_10250 [Desulfobacterales bacterium]|nr:hypothetical protein [Desulfobacterales bacterium]